MTKAMIFPLAISLLYLGAGIWYACARDWRSACIAVLFCASNSAIFLWR